MLIVPVVSGQDDDATATVVAIRSSTPRPSARSRSRSRPSAPRAAPTRSPGWSHRRSRWPACSRSGLGLRAPADRVARRRDPPRRRRGRAVAERHRGSDHHAVGHRPRVPPIEGLILGAYRFTDFRSDKTAPKDTGLREITALTADTKAKTQGDKQAPSAPRRSRPRWPPHAIWSTLPPSHLYPAEFAKRAKALGEAAGLEVEVLDDKELAKDGLRRRHRRRQGLVAPAAAGPPGAPGRARARRPRRSRWSARASRSTPAASPSSRPPTCTT